MNMPRLEKKEMLELFPQAKTIESMLGLLPPSENFGNLLEKSGLEGLDNTGFSLIVLGVYLKDNHPIILGTLFRDLYARLRATLERGMRTTHENYKQMILDTSDAFKKYKNFLRNLTKVDLKKEKSEDLEMMLGSLFDSINKLSLSSFKIAQKAWVSEPLTEEPTKST